MNRTRAFGFVTATIGTALLGAAIASAQTPPPLDLPSEPPAEVLFREGERVDQTVEAPALQEAPPSVVFTLQAVRILGNTQLDDAVLQDLTRTFIGKRIGQAEIESMRQSITRAYTRRGYATSGALIPDQDLEGGELVVRVVEGRLSRIRIEGRERFQENTLRARLWPDPDQPLNVERLGERLSLLQADPDIRSIAAELRPGERLGESVLIVRVTEGRHFDLAAEANNYRSPAIGSYTGVLSGELRNRFGLGDVVSMRGQLSEGLRDIGLEALLPIGARGPRLSTRFRYSDSEVVEAPFDVLDIESDYLSFRLGLAQTVYESFKDHVEFGLAFEWRRGRNQLGGRDFSFSEGADAGETIVSPLRLEASWTRRQPRRVVALRSILSLGLPVLDATNVRGANADAEYLSWILQGQLAHRFERLLGSELLVRSNLQLTSDPVLTLERFSIGGHASTRGFRENQIVRDQGVSGSLELRVPVWEHADGRPIFQVAPFFDVGHAWDHADRRGSSAKTLAAGGLSFRAFPHDSVTAVLSWAQRMTKATRPRANKDPQDYGIHFSITAALP
jgi:hemolysin activation/secretion protein